jgi:hypothetical protein
MRCPPFFWWFRIRFVYLFARCLSFPVHFVLPHTHTYIYIYAKGLSFVCVCVCALFSLGFPFSTSAPLHVERHHRRCHSSCMLLFFMWSIRYAFFFLSLLLFSGTWEDTHRRISRGGVIVCPLRVGCESCYCCVLRLMLRIVQTCMVSVCLSSPPPPLSSIHLSSFFAVVPPGMRR